MSGLENDLRKVNDKLEAVIKRLDYLEAVLTESRQYPEVTGLMRDLRVGTALYGEPLKLIQRLIGVRRVIERSDDHRDEISRIILNSLAIKGPMNISALTREVATARGKSSRVTVRKKVTQLLEEGIVEKGQVFEYKLVD